jgi:hypothetical protein
MILGRPINLILGAFTALFNVVILVLKSQGTEVDAALVAAINIAFGAIVVLIANQPPTVNAGSTINIVTPTGEPNRTTTVR